MKINIKKEKEDITKLVIKECEKSSDCTFILDYPKNNDFHNSICYCQSGDYIWIYGSLDEMLISVYSLLIEVSENSLEKVSSEIFIEIDEYFLERLLYSMKNNKVEIEIKEINKSKVKNDLNKSDKNILNEKDIVIVKNLDLNDIDINEYYTLMFMVDSTGIYGEDPYIVYLEKQSLYVFEVDPTEECNPEYYYKLLIDMCNKLNYELIEIIPSDKVELRRI